MSSFTTILQETIKRSASDLHLIVGHSPIFRVDGNLLAHPTAPKLTSDSLKEMVFSILTAEQKDLLLTNKEIDLSYALSQEGRFRVNVYFQQGSLAAAFRHIPYTIKSIEELNLPKVLHDFTNLKMGLVLVTGPTSHGKSTTLAAMINEINKNRSEHIVTIEDPVEYIYPLEKSIISQREMHRDTHSWAVALRSVLREDPNVVLVGEMRDYETIAAAITVAETGHLVFATLHTNSAAQTIDRIVDVFPENQQPQVRLQLSNTLAAVISLRLLPRIKGGLIPVAEIMLSSSAIKTTVREGKTHMIDNIIQTSQEVGMVPLEASLAQKVKSGDISLDLAKEWSLRPKELARLVER